MCRLCRLRSMNFHTFGDFLDVLELVIIILTPLWSENILCCFYHLLCFETFFDYPLWGLFCGCSKGKWNHLNFSEFPSSQSHCLIHCQDLECFRILSEISVLLIFSLKWLQLVLANGPASVASSLSFLQGTAYLYLVRPVQRMRWVSAQGLGSLGFYGFIS
jgi:hypothetical protein